MDEKEKIAQISQHPDFMKKDLQEDKIMPELKKVTNPIVKNFIKYGKFFGGKFSPKDILR